MGTLSEEAFLRTLSEIEFKGTGRSWNWLINNKPTAEFIEWFCQSVNSRNYLSAAELNEYEEILSSGEIPDGDELDEVLNSLLPDLPELDEINDDYFAELGREIEDLHKYSESLKSWVDHQRNELQTVETEVDQLKKKNDSLQVKFVNAHKQCLGKSSMLESSMHNLIKNLENQKAHSIQDCHDGLAPIFLAEMPLQRYIEESLLFSSQLNSYMDDMISTSTKNLSYGQNTGQYFSLKLENVKKGLLYSQVFRFEAEAERKALEHACEKINGFIQNRTLWRFASNPSMIMDNVLSLKKIFQNRKEEFGNSTPDSNQVRFQMPSNLWLSKLKKVVGANVQRQCIQIECLQQELLLLEKRFFCANLKTAVDVLKGQTATDLVWMYLLGGEVTEVLNLSRFARSSEEFLISEQRERIIRMDMMKQLKDRREYELTRAENWPLIDCLSNYFKMFSNNDESSFYPQHRISSTSEEIFHSLKILSKHSDNCASEKTKQEHLMKVEVENALSLMKARCKEVAVLKDSVLCNSTQTHVVMFPSKLLTFIQHCDPIFKVLKNGLAELKTRYKNEKQRSSTQKNALRNLWITFLINPEEMLNIIDQVNLQ